MKFSRSFSKIFKNVTWLISDKIIDIALRITIGVLIARYLGPEQFGYLTYALTVVALLSPIVKLGLSSIIVREITNEPDRAGDYLGTAFVLQFVCAIFLCLFVVGYVNFSPSDSRPTDGMLTVLSITLLFQCVDVFKSWNQSQVTSQYTVWSNRISIILSMVGKFGLISIAAALSYFVWAWIFQYFLYACLMLYFYLKYNSFSHWRFDRTLAIELLKKSWPMLFTAVSSSVYLMLDIVMMGKMQPAYEVGVYTAAVRISELVYYLPMIVSATLLPAIVRSIKLEMSEFNSRYQALVDVLSTYAILVLVFVLVAADFIILTIFGEEFSEAASILRVHVFAVLFVATGGARNIVLLAEDKLMFVMSATIVGAIINVVMNFILIPLYSGHGAATSTVVSFCVSGYLSSLFWRPANRHFRILSKSYLVFFRPKAMIIFLLKLSNAKAS